MYQIQLETLEDLPRTESAEAYWRRFPTVLYSCTAGLRLDADAHRAVREQALASIWAVAGQPVVTLKMLPLQLSRADMLTLVNNQPNAHVMNFYMGLLQVVPLALAVMLGMWGARPCIKTSSCCTTPYQSLTLAAPCAAYKLTGNHVGLMCLHTAINCQPTQNCFVRAWPCRTCFCLMA